MTYLGYVYATQAVLPRMKARDRGTIVHVGSALAYRGIPLQTAYCGAKHATQGFHEALRCELLHEKSNVHVTMVQMPAVNTPQFSWVLLPAAAASAAGAADLPAGDRRRATSCYAADHPRRREYWVGSSTAGHPGANAVAPGLLDRYLGQHRLRLASRPSEPHDPNAPDNLFDPADGEGGRDFGMHGEFGRRTDHLGSAAVGLPEPRHPRGDRRRRDGGPGGLAVGPALTARGSIELYSGARPRWRSCAVWQSCSSSSQG